MANRVSSVNFVGRRDELGRLQQALRSTAAGEPATVLVAGEAGIGKTRLVEQFAGQARQQAQIMLGRCLPLSGGGLPYGPIVDALRGLAHSLDPPELDELVGPTATDLAFLLSDATPARPSGPVSEFARSRLFELVLRFLDRLAQRRPVVAIFEDVHWVDRSTLDLLMFLVRMVRHERLLVVATYRSDELHSQHPLQLALAELDRSRHIERLELSRFDRKDLGLLLGGILGQPPSPATVQRIFARSDGNAFLAEELLASEANQLGQELPRRLQSILLARVAALTEDTRHVLQLTATAGRPIEHHLLAAAAQLPEARLLAATREAVDRQVLYTERDAYRFRHVLLQQAVYDELLPGERIQLHAAMAQALSEDPLANTLRQTSTELAHHWHIVRDYPKALEASIAAAQAAAEIYGFTEAHQQYERALSLWGRVPDAHEKAGLSRHDLLVEAAEAAGWAGLGGRAVILLQEALDNLDPMIGLTQAGVLRARLAEWLWDTGDSKSALVGHEEASRLVAAEPASAEKAGILAGYGAELMRQGHFSASRIVCEEAIAVARAVGAQAEEGHALNTLGCDLSELGDPDAGIAALRRSLVLSEATGSFDDIHRAYLNLGVVLADEAGRPHEGVDLVQQGLERMRELGLEFALPGNTLRSNLAGHLWSIGRWQEADEQLHVAVQRELPARYALALQLLAGRIHLGRGQFDLAAEQGRTAARMAEQLNDAISHSMLHGYLAELAIWRSDHSFARAAVARALQHLADSEEHAWVISLCRLGLRTEADAAERAHDQRASSAELADIYTKAEQLLAQARHSLAQVGSNLVDAREHAAVCEAEFTRVKLHSDPQRWAAVAASADSRFMPYRAAYARWRQTEALLASKAHHAAPVLREAHRATLALGERPMRNEIEHLAQRSRINLQPATTTANAVTGRRASIEYGLTPRESEVLHYLVEGRTNRQIARVLFISEKTASVHVSNIMSKLGAANRLEAAAITHRLGLLEPNA
jgi:DNA-binding CsgD family transcriptional regulator/tetratricopeptide (TPR) repeat protein